MLITTPRYLCFKKTLFSHTLCLSVTFVLILSTLIKKTIMKNYGNVLTSLCRFVGCVLLMQCSVSSLHAFPDYYFKQLSLQEGLSQTTVNCVLKDYKGIIWIGTQMGLNRFDQYELKNYFYDSYSPNSLPDNDICFLKEDSLLNLWIGTQEGLAIYNRGEDNFTLIYHNNAPVQAKAACLLTDGILFAGTGLWIYSYADRQLHSLPIINKGKAINDYFKYIKPWKKNTYVVGTQWKGVYLYHTDSHQLTPFTSCKKQHISSYFIDKQKNLWLSPYGEGMICYDVNGQEIARYSTQNSDLCNDIILDMLIYKDELWIATDGGGIARLNLADRTFRTIEQQSGNNNSLPSNSIKSLYVDHSQNLWAGTIRNGLLNIREVYMHTFQDVPLNNLYGLSNKITLCLYEEDGFMYIGTDGGGINRLNQTENIFKHYPSCSKEKVVSIAGYNSEELIASFYGKGLYFFNKRTGLCRPCNFISPNLREQINSMGIAINIYQFSLGKYYILAEQVYIYDLKTARLTPVQMTQIRKDTDTPISNLKVIASNDSITYLYGVKNIFCLNNRTQTLSPIYYSDFNITINCVCCDSQGDFWIATNRGLLRYNRHNKSAEKIETSLFSEARTTVYDPTDRIWIGARNMLFAYSISDKRFTIFDENDGALANEYMYTNVPISQSGDIYQCGVNGLLRICKNYPFKDGNIPTIKLMDIELNGATITNQVSATGKLTIPYHYTSLIIKLIRNEEDVFRRRIYRFHISGLARDIESYAPSLALYSLSPGHYEVSVSCSNRDGSWTEMTPILNLEIPTPWWQSPYLKLALIILFIIICIGYVTYYNRKKERKLQWELKEHKQNMNEEKIRFLINMSHELRTPLMLIYAPLKRLLNKEAITDNKLKEQLESICRQVRRMKNLIEMVLDVRRIEMGQKVLHLSTCTFNNWLEEIAGSFTNEYANKNVRLLYNFDNRIKEWTFDTSKCEMIVSNLLANALKFTPEGNSVTLTTQKEKGNIRISVIDEGIGLDEEDIKQLFVRFYQGKDSKEGSGIGLSYVKVLVELQGGKIEAYNNEKTGATFCFELPEREDKKNPSEQSVNISLNDVLRFSDRERQEQKPSQEEENFDTRNYSILIVEDNIELSNFLKEALKEHFQKVYTANNGEDAFNIATQKLPDIIVSDIMMQQGDGLELCQQIKRQEKTCFIPVVLLTARTDMESTASGYKSGADIYLTKPFEVDELIVIVRNLLKNRKILQKHYRNYVSSISSYPNIEEEPSNADERFLFKLNNIIIENLSNNQLDVDFIADKMGMSRTTLYNRVKAVNYVGINDCINNFRIEKALQMLRETDCNMLEISEAVGFSSQRYFSTFFKKMVGCTPSKYREENQKQELEAGS